MRILITILAAALLASPLAPRAQAKEVSIEFFYDSLDPYGEWIQTADYGFVWHPKEVSEDWRPYTDGSWAYTDAGWTWVSEEPYGAITYHYGRWTRLQDAGWVWVPDTEWAPAWVSWRRSEQYVGWAPLPPEATFKRDVGISSWSDSYYDIGPSQYSFVAVRDFGAPRLTKVVLPRRQNTTIITETRNITNITYTSGVIYNDGPQYTVISRESREPVRRLRLERRDDVVFEGHRVRGEGLRATIAGDALRIFAPAVSYRNDYQPQRVSRRVERVEVDRGWRDVAQAQEVRARFQQDAVRAPASLPKQPTFTRATTALGLTDNASRKANLDTDGKPRTDRESRSTAAGAITDQSRTPGATAAGKTNPGDRPPTTESAPSGRKPVAGDPSRNPATSSTGDKPGDRPPTTESAPNGRKPATAEVKPGKGRPESATTESTPGTARTAREGAEPDSPRSGKGAGPNATAPDREGTKPSAATRPDGAPESREGKPGTTRGSKERPDGAKPETARPDATRPSARPESGKPEARPDSERGGKKEPNVVTPGGNTEPRAPKAGNAPDRPETVRPEPGRGKEPKASTENDSPERGRKEGGKPEAKRPDADRPGAERGGSKEPKVSTENDNPERGRKEGGKPEAKRPDADRPNAERGGSKEPKASAPSAEPSRLRKESSAPEAPRRPEGAAPASRSAAPAGGPAAESKGKKGDKENDKDKEKGKRD